MWPEEPPVPLSTKIEQLFVRLLWAAAFVIVIGYGAIKLYELQANLHPFAGVKQAHRIAYAVDVFRNRYNAFPGDLPEAGRILPGCPGVSGSDCNPPAETAGDGIIGDPDLSKNMLIPAPGTTDESSLFWTHLYYAGLLDGRDLGWFQDMPPTSIKSKMGGRLVVGYMNSSHFPERFQPSTESSRKGIALSPSKGIVLLMVSDKVYDDGAAMDEAGKQTLGVINARRLDSGKMDDGHPTTGWIQAYGAPGCFKEAKNFRGDNEVVYNEESKEKDCNSIFWIFQERDGKLETVFKYNRAGSIQ